MLKMMTKWSHKRELLIVLHKLCNKQKKKFRFFFFTSLHFESQISYVLLNYNSVKVLE